MLATALASGTGTFTADDATPAGVAYGDNAPWLGAAVRELGNRAWVERMGHVQSTRPSRKANYIGRWRITDRAAAQTELDRLRRLLLTAEPSSEPGLFGPIEKASRGNGWPFGGGR